VRVADLVVVGVQLLPPSIMQKYYKEAFTVREHSPFSLGDAGKCPNNTAMCMKTTLECKACTQAYCTLCRQNMWLKKEFCSVCKMGCGACTTKCTRCSVNHCVHHAAGGAGEGTPCAPRMAVLKSADELIKAKQKEADDKKAAKDKKAEEKEKKKTEKKQPKKNKKEETADGKAVEKKAKKTTEEGEGGEQKEEKKKAPKKEAKKKTEAKKRKPAKETPKPPAKKRAKKEKKEEDEEATDDEKEEKGGSVPDGPTCGYCEHVAAELCGECDRCLACALDDATEIATEDDHKCSHHMAPHEPGRTEIRRIFKEFAWLAHPGAPPSIKQEKEAATAFDTLAAYAAEAAKKKIEAKSQEGDVSSSSADKTADRRARQRAIYGGGGSDESADRRARQRAIYEGGGGGSDESDASYKVLATGTAAATAWLDGQRATNGDGEKKEEKKPTEEETKKKKEEESPPPSKEEEKKKAPATKEDEEDKEEGEKLKQTQKKDDSDDDDSDDDDKEEEGRGTGKVDRDEDGTQGSQTELPTD
jgi:hypothetical protein